MIELEDILLAISVAAVAVGLGMVYLPLALIVPGVLFIGWATWKRRVIGRGR